jgi:hypothetical protein
VFCAFTSALSAVCVQCTIWLLFWQYLNFALSRYVIIIIIIIVLTATGLSPGGSGYFTCAQNMKLVTTGYKSGGLREKHAVATWNVGNRLSVCL